MIPAAAPAKEAPATPKEAPSVVAATRPAPRATDGPRDEFEEGYFYTAKSANRGVLYASSSPSELMEKYRIS